MSHSAALWTIAHHAPLSMRFSRQEYWSGLLFPPPGNLPGPGIELVSPALQVGFFLPLSHLGIPFKVLNIHTVKFNFCATYNINIFTFCLAFFFNLAINIWESLVKYQAMIMDFSSFCFCIFYKLTGLGASCHPGGQRGANMWLPPSLAPPLLPAPLLQASPGGQGCPRWPQASAASSLKSL